MATPPSASVLHAFTLFGLLVSSSLSAPAHAQTTTGPVTSCVELLPVSGYASAFGVVHTCGPRRRLKMWGANAYGALGIEDNLQVGLTGGIPVNGTTLKFIKGVGNKHVLTGCGGAHFTCVVLGDSAASTAGDVKCFGNNQNGELGVNRNTTASLGLTPGDLENAPFVDLNGDKVTAMSCGYITTCALTTNKEIKCWGSNHFGQAGVESSDTYVNDLGENLKPVKLPGIQFTSVGVGLSTCGSGPNGTFCWGHGENGALGNPTLNEMIVGGTPGSMALLADLPVQLGLNPDEFVTKVVAGATLSCALVGSTESSQVRAKCWGSNVNGELGYGDMISRGLLESDMGANLEFVKYGENKSVVQLSAGYEHICARFSDYTATCFGKNLNGELGIAVNLVNAGSTLSTVGQFIRYLKSDDKPVWDIAAGVQATAMIIGKYHDVVAFGSNQYAMLGRVDTNVVGNSPEGMETLPAIDLGFCTARNFLEVPSRDFAFTSESYYVYNPMSSTTVYVRIQSNSASVTGPEFNRTVEIKPRTKHVFSAYFNGEDRSSQVSISGVYWCKSDEGVQEALPTLTLNTTLLSVAPQGNGTQTSAAADVAVRLWGVALAVVLALFTL